MRSCRGTTGRSKLLVTPPQLLTMAFGLAKTCLGKCGHNLVFTSFFIRMFKFIYIFPYCYGPPIEFVQDIATTSFWSLTTVNSILIFAAFVTFTFPTSTLLVP